MDAFLTLFGDYEFLGIRLGHLALFLLLCFTFYHKLYKGAWIPYYEAQKEKDHMLQAAVREVSGYRKLREQDQAQSRKIQAELTESLNRVIEKQEELSRQLGRLDERNRRYELSSSRGKLLSAYRYYTGEHSNPQRAWTEMVAHAFWEQFGSYEEAGGNDYMHATVQVEMNKLSVIPMSDQSRIAQLMKSRQTSA